MGATQNLLLTVENAETGQRGFVITGDPAFLEPYLRAAHTTIPQELSSLEHLGQDNEQQRQRAAHLRQLLKLDFGHLNRWLPASQYGSNQQAARFNKVRSAQRP